MASLDQRTQMAQALLSPEEQALASMSPIDALKMSTELQNRRVYTPQQAVGNQQQTLMDFLYASPVGNALSLRDAMEGKWNAQQQERQGDTEGARRNYAAAAANALMGFLPGMGRIGVGRTADAIAHEADSTLPAIMAWHASPHEFDRFDFSKIGTGEGAQVYGHGGYFAESPAVSGKGGAYYNQFLDSHGKAHAYKIELDVEPHQLLDWDKPLSEQKDMLPKLQSIAHEMMGGEGNPQLAESLISNRDLGMFYDEMSQFYGGPSAAANRLREAGIPGIRYLDQGSRGTDIAVERVSSGYRVKDASDTGSRTFLSQAEAQAYADKLNAARSHNFVIFDDALAKILSKE
jgi:hypothetical protein